MCPLQYATFDKDLIFHNYNKNMKKELKWFRLHLQGKLCKTRSSILNYYFFYDFLTSHSEIRRNKNCVCLSHFNGQGNWISSPFDCWNFVRQEGKKKKNINQKNHSQFKEIQVQLDHVGCKTKKPQTTKKPTPIPIFVQAYSSHASPKVTLAVSFLFGELPRSVAA